MIAYTLQSMLGDKQKTTGEMSAISASFVEIVSDFIAKLDANETIPIKTYYKGALKQSLIDENVKNLQRRLRFLL